MPLIATAFTLWQLKSSNSLGLPLILLWPSLMKVLLTGASGHLGSNVLTKLSQVNNVHVVSRLAPSCPYPGVVYHSIDLSRNWSTDGLPEHVDAVIHLAQSRYFRDFPRQALDISAVNLFSTVTLLDYAMRAGATRFVLASTGGLHSPSASLITADSPVDPPCGLLEYYFRTKLAAEQLALSYAEFMDVTILRPFFIYGPGQSHDKLIARLLSAIRSDQSIKLVGRNGLVINPVFVDDAAQLLLSLLDVRGSSILMVAGPSILSLRAIACEIALQCSRNPIFENIEGDECMLVADHRPAEVLLARPLTVFSEGIQRLLRSTES